MITSRHNTFIKQIKSLADKKERDKTGLFTVESIKLVNEAITTCQQLESIVGTEKGLKGVLKTDCRTEVVSEDVFKTLSSEVSPEGVLAVIKKPQVKPLKICNNAVLLDGVSDPGNVGAIIRTSAASGYKDVFLTQDSADAFSPKSIRASMGGIFRVNIHVIERKNADTIGLPLIVADMNGEDMNTVKITGNFCLVVGSESHGVSDFIKQKAEKTVCIPMKNNVESLNVAVSSGILMYVLNK